MSVITGTRLAKAYGDDDIFQDVSVSIPHGARIALVGPNGSGKTTLLRILEGSDSPSDGSVTRMQGLQVGFLPQEADLIVSGERPLWDEMLVAFEGLIAQEAKLHQMAEQLAASPADQELLDAYGQAQAHFELVGGYEYTTLIQKTLGGLGFDQEDFQRPVSQLSGGQKTRALLARLLLEQPDLLVLDEPTNHLDIQAIEWLEKWLKNFKGALLIVSHDRYFMDNVVNHIWELIFGRLEEYRGNYSHYLKQREERHQNLLTEYERQQEFVAKTEDYIARNIAGQNTRQAQGRRRRLERFLRDEAITRPREQRFMRLNLQSKKRSGDRVLSTHKLVIGYHDDGVPLFNVPDITLIRGECAALIGPNGTGKSTFLKTILAQLAPLDGLATLGAGVEVGYFAQAHEGLDADKTVIDEILTLRNMPISEARSFLATFLFTGDDVYKPVASLSGGERGRVALAKLSLSGANLLLLDEPTNHLDIPSQEILEAVLADFDGTILLVSHDRYLIRNLATQIWTLHVPRRGSGPTEMVVHEGPYDEYIARRDGKSTPMSREHDKSPVRSAQVPIKTKPALSAHERKKRLTQVEQAIHQLEIDLVNLSGGLQEASTAGNISEVSRLGSAYTDAEHRLNILMEEWEALLVES
jgi:ATP-binding cassette subfamily F protein 3